MISVKALDEWVKEHAVGRSASHPEGFVKAQDLYELFVAVKSAEPLSYDFVIDTREQK